MESPEEREVPTVITSDTENATTIHPNEAPPGENRKYRKFRAYNTGMWNGPKRENTEMFRREDNLHRFDALSSSLNLNSYQKNRGRNILDEMNIQKMGLKVDVIIFGICVVVANSDVNDGTRYWPHPKSDSNDKQFARVAESIEMTRKEQLSIVQKMKSKID